MPTQNAVSLKLSAAKLEVKAALSSLERVSSHEYSPHQAALIRGAQFQLERALRICNQIYLKPSSSFAASTQPLVVEKVIQSDIRLLPPPKNVTSLPVEDTIRED